jgi:hypothetical protein
MNLFRWMQLRIRAIAGRRTLEGAPTLELQNLTAD